MPKNKKTDPELLSDLESRYGRFIGIPDAAAEVGTSVRSLKRDIADGVVPLYRIGTRRVLRLKTADVAALVERVA